MEQAEKKKLLERLRKIHELAKRGVGGEKENAEKLLARLLKDHNVKLEDFEDDIEYVETYSYQSKHEKQILYQIIAMEIGAEFSYQQHRGKNRINIMASKKQHKKMKSLFKRSRKQYKKEALVLLDAFIAKHKLYPKEPIEATNDDDDIDWEHIRRALAMAQGLGDMPLGEEQLIVHRKKGSRKKNASRL